MSKTLISENYTSLLKIVVALVCGNEGVSLVDFSDQLEKLIRQLTLDGFNAGNLNKFLVGIERAITKNDFVTIEEHLQ